MEWALQKKLFSMAQTSVFFLKQGQKLTYEKKTQVLQQISYLGLTLDLNECLNLSYDGGK